MSRSKEKTAAQTPANQTKPRKREIKETEKQEYALQKTGGRRKSQQLELIVTNAQSDLGHRVADDTIQSPAGQTRAPDSLTQTKVSTDATVRKNAKSSQKKSMSELIDVYRKNPTSELKLQLLSKIPGAERCEQLLEKVRQQPGMENLPSLFSKLMTKCTPRLPQSSLPPWHPKTTPSELVPSKSLLEGGILDHPGLWQPLLEREGYEFMMSSWLRLCQETLATCKQFQEQNVASKVKRFKVKEMILVDAVLAKYCCDRPCGAHYYLHGYFYWNYVKSYSQRGITNEDYPKQKDILRHDDKQFAYVASLAEQDKDSEETQIDYDHQEQLQGVCKMMEAASLKKVFDPKQEPAVNTVTLTVETQGPDGGNQRTANFSSFYGVTYRHAVIYQDPQVSGCCDMYRKNRVTAELAVSVNQAFCVYDDMKLLEHGIPTTNDLVNIVRDHYPEMFEAIFERVYSVAQSTPFTLDAQFIAGKRLSVVGKLNEQNQLDQLRGHLELRRVLLHTAGRNQDLTVFVLAIQSYLDGLVKSVQQHLKQLKADNKKATKIERLESVLKTLQQTSPLIQIDYVDPKNLQKFCFVTNVRINEEGKLLIRELNQTAPLINLTDVQEQMKDRPEAHKQPDLDRVLASKNLSKGKLSHTQFYHEWGEAPTALKNPMIVKLDQDDALKNAQQEITDRLGVHSKYNRHLAVLLTDHFNPTSLGFKVNDANSVRDSVNRLKRLNVESAALYIVEFVPEYSTAPGSEYWETLAFYLKCCYRMNEFTKHSDFMNKNRHLSHLYQYLMEDVLGRDPFKSRFPDCTAYHIRGDIETAEPGFLHRVVSLQRETEDPKILTVPKALNLLGSIVPLEQNRLEHISKSSAKMRLERLSEYMSVDRQSIPVRGAAASRSNFASENEHSNVRNSNVSLRHDQQNGTLTIDVDAPTELITDAKQQQYLQQRLTSTLHELDTIKKSNITHTSFDQVSAAYSIAQARASMNPREKELYNLLQTYLNESDKADDASLAVKYLEDVYKTNQISFEVFAFDKTIVVAKGAELKVKNSLLPADNLILLPVKRYDCYTSADGKKKHTLLIKNQKQFFAVFHHCQLFILAWLTKHSMPYDREKFRRVIVDSWFAWRNFLAGAGINLVLPAGENALQEMHKAMQYEKNLKGCIWTKFVFNDKVKKKLLSVWALVNELNVSTQVPEMADTMLPYLLKARDMADKLTRHDSGLMKIVISYDDKQADKTPEEEKEENSDQSLPHDQKAQKKQIEVKNTNKSEKPVQIQTEASGSKKQDMERDVNMESNPRQTVKDSSKCVANESGMEQAIEEVVVMKPDKIILEPVKAGQQTSNDLSPLQTRFPAGPVKKLSVDLKFPVYGGAQSKSQESGLVKDTESITTYKGKKATTGDAL